MNQLSILEQTSDFSHEGKWMIKRFKFLYAINQVLLLHRGPVLEFNLSIKADDTCLEIDQIILHLLRIKTIRKFRLVCGQLNIHPIIHGDYRLPLSIFSLHELTDLHLRWCYLDHQPTFNGFGSLTTLYLEGGYISSKSLLHLLSNCPLLKTLSLFLHEDNILDNNKSTITELFECVPVLEQLSMWNWMIERFALDGVPRVLPTTLVHLKHFLLKDCCFTDEYWLPFIGLVIRSSPNLEKLMLMMYPACYEKTERDLVSLKDYSDIWLEHLNEFKIGDFRNFKHEMEFVKLILAKSPVLKKVIIYLEDEITKDEEMLILRILLRSPRASPIVEIIVERNLNMITEMSLTI